MAQSINLTPEAMNEINNKLEEAATDACSHMKELIESLEEKTKQTQIFILKTATQEFITLYNESLLSSIKENCNRWRESENGIVNTIKRVDPGNEDALEPARKFEEQIQSTAESSIANIEEFNCSTANPQITQSIYDECAEEFGKALSKIESLYSDKKREFDSNAEQNAIYESCSEVLVVMLKSFEGVYEGGRDIFKKLGEASGLDINAVFTGAQQAATVAVGQKDVSQSMIKKLLRARRR